MLIGGKEFDLKNGAYIMGILNVTPDSFSDGGKFDNMDSALFHVEQMIKDGASIIDIGGQSTRPGYEKISNEEEIERVVPVLEKIKDRFDTVVSIDTFESKVAKACIESGADMINDIWGLLYDKDMAGVVAASQLPVCIMHNRDNTVYNNFMEDVLNDMRKCIKIAKDAGIGDHKIILDPGVGFGKNYEQNLQVIREVEKFNDLGYPVLLGISRKSFIGLTLDLPVDERLEGTIAANVIGYMKGCSIFRVHDVKENYRALKLTEGVLHG